MRLGRTAVLGALVLAVSGSGCHHDSGAGDRDVNEDQGVPPDGSANDLSGFVVADGAVLVCLPGLATLTLAPADSQVTLSGGTPVPISLTVTGTFQDGHTEMIDPATLGWKATRDDDTPAGAVVAGVFSPFANAGGTVTLLVTDGCVTGTTTVKLTLNVTVGTPVDPASWSGAPVTTGTVPTVVYPSDQTRFPRNIYRTLFQWRTAGYAQFRLTFTGPGSTVVVYTDGVNPLCAGKTPAAGCWEAGETEWSYIAGSNAGASVTWTVDGLDTSTSTPTIRRSSVITAGFSRRDVLGAIFYWSTTSAGVRRANIKDAVPEDYITGKPGTTYSMPTDQVKCVACHMVSRDGKYMAAPVQAMSGNGLWIAQVTANAPPTPLVKDVANTMGNGFASISPDDSQVAVAWGGKLWTVDRATGAFGQNIALGGMLQATHPDWSPDNTQLAFATGNGDAPAGASIDLIPYLNPGWGTPTTLVASNGTGMTQTSNLFPMFSPDGKWIAFSRGKGGHSDITAQLWVVGSTAGATPVEMINANRVVSNVLGNGQTENNQPTWAPPGDLYWVAFNSQREYGVVSKAGTQQIWVAAVDPAKLGGTSDPSYPAFRLQFQGLMENNHRAFWTLDVRDNRDGGAPPPDMASNADLARACIADNATCDPVLDHCCDSTYHCDTSDNGVTYTCIAPIF